MARRGIVFIYGPKHGQRIEIDDDQDIVVFPILSTFPGGISCEVVNYEYRRRFLRSRLQEVDVFTYDLASAIDLDLCPVCEKYWFHHAEGCELAKDLK